MALIDESMPVIEKEEERQRLEHQEILQKMENLGHKDENEQRRESVELNAAMQRRESTEGADRVHRKHSPAESKGFVSAASEALHDVAEKTREFAHEVKEKITGHVTDHDISKATKHLHELRDKLGHEQQALRDIQLQALVAEQALNLKEYENLKEREIKAKKEERATELKIHEASDHLDYLMNQRRLHLLRQRCSERDQPVASSAHHQPTMSLTPPLSPKIKMMPVPMN